MTKITFGHRAGIRMFPQTILDAFYEVPARVELDRDAFRKVVADYGITVPIFVQTGPLGQGTQGMTTPPIEDRTDWTVLLDDTFTENALQNVTDQGLIMVGEYDHMEDVTFTFALCHELGHVKLLSEEMARDGLTGDQVVTRHSKSFSAGNEVSQNPADTGKYMEYTQNPDEVAANEIARKYIAANPGFIASKVIS